MQPFVPMTGDEKTPFALLREAAGYPTQSDLARAAKVNPQTINQIESGERGVSLEMALKLEELLGVPIRCLPVRNIPEGDALPTVNPMPMSLVRGSISVVGSEAVVAMTVGEHAREWVPSVGLSTKVQWYRISTDGLAECRFYRGDLVAVEPDAVLTDQCKVMVRFQADPADTPIYYLKMYFADGHMEPLLRKSPKTSPDDDGYVIIGRVVRVARQETID